MAKDDKPPEAVKKAVLADTAAGANAIQPNSETLKAEEVDLGDDTVTMVFPRQVRLQHLPGQILVFQAGVQEVPAKLADHQYLKDHGVKRHRSGKEKEQA